MPSYREAFQDVCHVSIPRTRHQFAVPPGRILVTDVTQTSPILFDSGAVEDATVAVVVHLDPEDGTVELTFAVPQSGEVWLCEEGVLDIGA
jgi:hypothetical protein